MKTQNIIYNDTGQISYQTGLELQTACFNRLIETKRTGKTGENYLFFCEHLPVLTIGKSGKETNLLISKKLLTQKGIELYEVSRGGDITYHGPGQITGYPILDLDQWKMGLKKYVHTLEEVIIRFLSLYGIEAGRLSSATGVWIEPANEKRTRKICAIGVKSSRFVTMHGFALNINTDLNYFKLINPCGFTDKGVTSLQKELGRSIDMEKAKKQLAEIFLSVFVDP